MRIWVFGVSFGIAGIAAIMWASAVYGPGFFPDAAYYLSCAQSLVEGNGFIQYDGRPFVGWPPLYPMLLAFISLFVPDPVLTARLVNAASFGLSVFCFFYLLRMGLRSGVFIILGVISLALASPMIRCALMVWSESLFTLFLILFIIFLQKFLDRPKPGFLAAMSIIAALACLQRYFGVTLIITGLLTIFLGLKEKSRSEKIKYCAVFLVVAALPLSVWMARNYMVASVFTGFRISSPYTFTHYIIQTLSVISGWFFPQTLPFCLPWWGRVVMLGVLFVLLVFAGWGFSFKSKNLFKWNLTWTISIFAAIYVVFLIGSSVVTSLDIRPSRYLAPICFAFIFWVMLLLERISEFWAQKYAKGWWVRFFLAAFIVLWMGYQFNSVIYGVSCAKNASPQIQRHFSHRELRDMPMLSWLRNNPVDYQVYCSNPDVLYLYCGIWAKRSPKFMKDLFEFAEKRSVFKKTRLVLIFPPPGSGSDLPPDLMSDYRAALGSVLSLEIEASFREGVVFFVKSKKEKKLSVTANNIGEIHIKNNRLKLAQFWFEKAISLEPGCIAASYNLACVHARQNRIKESISWLKRAVSLGFDNWELLKNEPGLKNLRNTPFYIELIKGAGPYKK